MTAVRASDAERDEVARVLERAAADGRLTPEEAGERLAQVSGARYRDELAAFVSDLPVPTSRGTPRLVGPRLWVMGSLFTVALFAVLLIGAWTLVGLRLFWPFWLLAFVGWRVFGFRGRRWRARRWIGAGSWGGTWGRPT